jgi:hypothetical protein
LRDEPPRVVSGGEFDPVIGAADVSRAATDGADELGTTGLDAAREDVLSPAAHKSFGRFQ